eukprot:8857466-Pyramimonas_sp.AAC.1
MPRVGLASSQNGHPAPPPLRARGYLGSAAEQRIMIRSGVGCQRSRGGRRALPQGLGPLVVDALGGGEVAELRCGGGGPIDPNVE